MIAVSLQKHETDSVWKSVWSHVLVSLAICGNESLPTGKSIRVSVTAAGLPVWRRNNYQQWRKKHSHSRKYATKTPKKKSVVWRRTWGRRGFTSRVDWSLFLCTASSSAGWGWEAVWGCSSLKSAAWVLAPFKLTNCCFNKTTTES